MDGTGLHATIDREPSTSVREKPETLRDIWRTSTNSQEQSILFYGSNYMADVEDISKARPPRIA